MVDKLEIVRNAVEATTNEVDWKYHLVPVLKYANQLAKFFTVDRVVLELAVLLHDIGRFKHGSNNHHLTGIPEAVKILSMANYSDAIIKEIILCIRSHRGFVDILPQTIIAEIVANADAMSHFDILPLLFLPKLSKDSTQDDIEEQVKRVSSKIEQNWNKKLTIPEAKAMVKEKYQAIMLILNSTKSLM